MRWTKEGAIRLLDFDIETRKVGFHTGGRFSPDGCEPTTIAACWIGEKKVHVWAQPEHTLPEILVAFMLLYNEAELVTGHYIRKFDLPIINGSLLEHGLPMLTEKWASDTKGDLMSFSGLSKSQENLSGMLRLADEKYHMADFRWRESTRLTVEGAEEAKKRATSDVRQHIRMRAALIEAGALRGPRVWRP